MDFIVIGPLATCWHTSAIKSGNESSLFVLGPRSRFAPMTIVKTVWFLFLNRTYFLESRSLHWGPDGRDPVKRASQFCVLLCAVFFLVRPILPRHQTSLNADVEQIVAWGSKTWCSLTLPIPFLCPFLVKVIIWTLRFPSIPFSSSPSVFLSISFSYSISLCA